MNEGREAATSTPPPGASRCGSGTATARAGCGISGGRNRRDNAAGILNFRLALRDHHQKWSFGIGPLPVNPGTIAGDEAMADQFLSVNLAAPGRSPLRHGERQTQIADFERLIAEV